MYALHPGSLPPKGATDKYRIDVSAEDLQRLYKLEDWEFILWDPAEELDYMDFIHLYPSYYGRYTLTNGKPSKDVPLVTKSLRGR